MKSRIKQASEKINELNRLKEFSLNNQKIFGNNKIMKLGDVCELNVVKL